MLEGVLEQVAEDLAEPPLVHRERRQVRGEAASRCVTRGGFGEGSAGEHGVGDHVLEPALPQLEARGLAVLEQVVHQVRQPVELLAEHLDVLAVVVRSP